MLDAVCALSSGLCFLDFLKLSTLREQKDKELIQLSQHHKQDVRPTPPPHHTHSFHQKLIEGVEASPIFFSHINQPPQPILQGSPSHHLFVLGRPTARLAGKTTPS
jgi:hypothetical protein